MPAALKFILGGDATPFIRELGKMEAVSQQTTAKQIQMFEKAEVALLGEMATLGKNTAAWENYAATLDSVRAKKAQLESQMVIGGQKSGISTINAPNRNLTAEEQYSSDYQRLLREKDVSFADRYGNLAGTSGRSRATAKADSGVSSAAQALSAAMAGGGDVTAERNALAGALRARRALRELGDEAKGTHGRLRGLGAGWSELVHVFRATADSLAAGMSPLRVLGQQGPRVFQAILALGIQVPWLLVGAWAAAALEIVGSLYLIVSHFKKVAEEARNLREFFGYATRSLSEFWSATEEGARSAAKFATWLHELNRQQSMLAEKSDDAVDAIRRQAKAAADLADANKEAQLAQLELDEKTGKVGKQEALKKRTAIEQEAITSKEKAELDALRAEKKQLGDDLVNADKAFDAAKEKAADADAKATTDPRAVALRSALAASKAKLETTKKVAEEADKDASIGPNEMQHITVDGKTYVVSKRQADWEVGNEESRIKGIEFQQRGLDQTAEDAKKAAEDAKAARDKIGTNFDKTSRELTGRETNDPAIIAAKLLAIDLKDKAAGISTRTGGFDLSQNQRNGAFIGGPGLTMIDLQRVANDHLSNIVNNTRPGVGNSSKPFRGGAH